jgi:hypothetical protein
MFNKISKGKFIYRNFFIACITIICIVVSSCQINSSTNHDKITLVEFPPTPKYNLGANKAFLDVANITDNYDLNRGITLERISTILLDGIPTPSPNFISLLILNHTDEPILFENQGFGIRVYEYDPATKSWSLASLPYSPMDNSKTLPPHVESFDFELLNSWQLNESDLAKINKTDIRIIVVGEGVKSSQKYGAYLDTKIEK